MIRPNISIILFTLVLASCTMVNQPEQITMSTLTQRGCTQEIYEVDYLIRTMEKKISGLVEEAYQKGRDKKFELVHELKEKIEKSERELKELRTNLEKLLLEYKQNWQSRPWWQKMALEVGPQYTHFDEDLDLEDKVGTRLKIHWVKQEFRPFHLGSYLHYPAEPDLAYPLKQVEASGLIIEYRNIRPETDQPIQQQVKVNSYLVGFGLLGQSWKDTYIKVNLAGGLQRYTGTEPGDTGPVISYTLGLHQKISHYFGIELDVAGEVCWTKANQQETHAVFNLSTAFLIRCSF